MINRILLIVIFVPLAVILVALAVANRVPVAFTFDPFNPGNAALTVHAPLFVYLFLAVILGMILGSAGTWLKQGRYRRQAREQKREVETLLKDRQRARPAAPSAPALPARSV